ncbi:MAG: trypsin-like peptidase domain-containing protein [Anaerolineales bacterium]|nr:trypsin-like peptidase domain-containing protein [Anaerolineales bacterium]
MTRKLTLTTILLFAMLLSACSTPAAALSQQAAGLLQSAANALEQEAEVAPAAEAQAQATPALPASEASGLLAAYEGALENVYIQVNPSVVNIRVLQQTAGMGGGTFPGLPFNFPGMPEAPQPDTPQYGEGLGSGFVWDQEGHIVTNNHVVAGADEIEVTFSDGATVDAELVGADPDSDLAVIKVDLPVAQLKPVQLADSRQVRVGELAIAIGNPYGLEGTMTVGIISALGRSLPSNLEAGARQSYTIPDVIQTDAPINPGNSGGVLVDDQGRVIGVTFAIESTTGANAGIGFAIPSAIVQRVVPALIEDGAYQHPYLGISGLSLNRDLAEAMNLKAEQRGALVAEVTPSGPADEGGLRGGERQVEIDGQAMSVGGDVVVAIDGQAIQGMDDLIAYLANNANVGDQVTLSVLRDGKEKDIQVTLGARPSAQAAQSAAAPQGSRSQARVWLGITGAPMTPEIAESMGLPADQGGALVEQVQEGSPADESGLRSGDLIIAVDNQQVEAIQQLGVLLQAYNPGDQVRLTILRDGEQMEVEVTLGERPD